MSGTDPWAKQWTLNFSDDSDVCRDVLVNNGMSPSIFRLKPIYDPDNGNLVAYRVDFNKNEMTPFWKGCYLFPRGGNASALNDSTMSGLTLPLPLPPWTVPTGGSTPSPDYQTVAAEIRQENDNKTRKTRLEGDIHDSFGNAESVTLWQVKTTTPPSSTRDILTNHTFLALKVASDDPSQQNGIAHGND